MSKKEQTAEDMLKEFQAKVLELKKDLHFPNNETKIHEFGYKTLVDDEVFTVVDWANIEAFFWESLKAAEARGALEIVICSAVKTTTGKILRGHRHCDCLAAIKRSRFAPSPKAEDQGFITSKNRYVDRAEGYDLQIKAGIKSVNTEFTPAANGYCTIGQLYSEDLY